MLHRVNFSEERWRYLYQYLYSRVLSFALAQGETIEEVNKRFARLILNDPSLILLVELNGINIISHCLLNISPPFVGVEQIESLSRKDNTFAQECIDYVEEVIADTFQVSKMIMSTSLNKHKAFTKKYNFEVERVIMSRDIKIPSLALSNNNEDYGESGQLSFGGIS